MLSLILAKSTMIGNAGWSMLKRRKQFSASLKRDQMDKYSVFPNYFSILLKNVNEIIISLAEMTLTRLIRMERKHNFCQLDDGFCL